MKINRMEESKHTRKREQREGDQEESERGEKEREEEEKRETKRRDLVEEGQSGTEEKNEGDGEARGKAKN